MTFLLSIVDLYTSPVWLLSFIFDDFFLLFRYFFWHHLGNKILTASFFVSEKKLENLLRAADQTSSLDNRCNLMNRAVETAEELPGIPLGNLGQLYQMTATAHVNAKNYDSAEKYFLISINRWVRSGVDPASERG